MHQRPRARTLSRRQLLTVGGTLLAPAALLAWWQPWRTTTTLTVPAPTPLIPTATSTPERIALPSERLRPSATPAATITQVAATPPRAATPAISAAESSAAGTLLYLGAVDGWRGVVAASADGSDHRLLLRGIFDSLAVSPDGARLAVVGAIPNGGGTDQLAIVDGAGRALARHPVGRRFNGTPTWSPGGTHLLCSILADDSTQLTLRWETWAFGDDGARQILPPSPADAILQGWTPDGRIAFITGEDPARPRMQTLWTTDAAGGDRQKVYEWAFSPLGWNRDGAILYALAFADPDDHDAPLGHLIGIDRPSGGVHLVVSADALAISALGLPDTPGGYRFDFAYPSPDGTRFALGVARAYRPGTPAPRTGLRATTVIFIHRDRQITGIAHIPPGDMRGPGAWSPDGTRFAFLASNEREGDGQLHAFEATGDRLATFPVPRAYVGNLPHFAWSLDGQWLAYTGLAGLYVAALPLSATFFASRASYPTWRSLPRP